MNLVFRAGSTESEGLDVGSFNIINFQQRGQRAAVVSLIFPDNWTACVVRLPWVDWRGPLDVATQPGQVLSGPPQTIDVLTLVCDRPQVEQVVVDVGIVGVPASTSPAMARPVGQGWVQ